VEERFRCYAAEDVFNAFWQLEAEMHHLMLIQIFGSSFGGVFELCNHDFSLAGNLYGQIINNAASAMRGRRVVEWARSPIMLLHLYYTGQMELFLEEICDQFDDVRHATPSLQWLIMSNYVILLHKEGIGLESHPNYQRFLDAYAGLGFPTDLMKPAVPEKYAAAGARGVPADRNDF
jgi:hypothetical protein